MLENITIKMRINQTNHDIKNCYFRQCVNNDYSMIVDIQNKIVEELIKTHNEKMFFPTNNEIIKEFLCHKDVYFICLQIPDGICSYSYTCFNGISDLNYYFKNEEVATFDTVVVLPQFRGNKLQSQLIKITELEAKKRNMSILAAIVSPDNIHSVNNFMDNKFKILKRIIYKKLKRYIVYKYL